MRTKEAAAGLLRYRFLLANLILKDLRLKYRRSVLGVLWSVLNPLLMMLVMTAVFSRIFRVAVENYPVFYLTGSTLFAFLGEATTGAMGSVTGSASLLRKVRVPKSVFPLEKVLFASVNYLFSLVAVVVMFVVLGQPFHWTFALFWLPALFTGAFALGVGLALASLSVFFRDIVHLYSVLLVAWQFATPVLYPYEALPESIQALMIWNPMYHYVQVARMVLMHGIVPSAKEMAVCAGMALAALAVGAAVFRAKRDRFVLYV